MPKIQIPEKLLPVLTTDKRFVVLLGGRSSAKSETMGRILLLKSQTDQADTLCGREFQNSIEDSVHKLLKGLITKIGVDGYQVTDKKIEGVGGMGGGFRFKGFARNPENVKSAQDFKRSWMEEAQSLSQKSLDDLLPTIRAEGSQLFFTANPQSSSDPFSKRFIVPFMKDLLKHGYYEDDMHLIIFINWRDNPWHGELESQRVWDFENLSRTKYDHIWEGAFLDDVEDSIIKAEWFDAAIDSHLKKGFEPRGALVVSHDPSDTGTDDKGLVVRQGSVIFSAEARRFGDVNEGCDWALDRAIEKKADLFTWDADGMGVSLKRQVSTSLSGKKIDYNMFHGSEGAWRPGDIYEETGPEDHQRQKTNKNTFKNRRAQFYWYLRDRFWNTFRSVEKGIYVDPDKMISISSEIESLQELRNEVCRIPRKYNGQGTIQIMTKQDMLRLGIDSPNLADALMMSEMPPEPIYSDEPMEFDTFF